MPRLLLLRHAKAERSGKGSARDFDRALSERGVEDAEAIGRVMAGRGDRIDLVLCSPSKRTRETWDGVRKSFGGAAQPRYLRDIYDARKSYLEILREQAGDAAAVLLIGHNPSIQDTATALIGVAAGQTAAAMKGHFPTSALAILEFDGGWGDLAPGTARLAAFIRPREHTGD